jgi:hypothetical protein
MRRCTHVTAAIHVTTNCQDAGNVAMTRACLHISGEGCVVAGVNGQLWRGNLHADPHVIGSQFMLTGRNQGGKLMVWSAADPTVQLGYKGRAEEGCHGAVHIVY